MEMSAQISNLLALAFLLCLKGVPASIGAPAEEKSRHPNVLFILGDDLNNNLGCYEHPAVKSPHIDKLARRGVRFDRAYCQYPLCNPSRTSLLSGRRPESKPTGAVWLPDHLKAQGYYTVQLKKVAHSYGPSATNIGWDLTDRKGDAKRAAELMQQPRDKPFFISVGLTHTHPGYAYTREYLNLYPFEKIELPREPAEAVKNVPEIAIKGVLVEKDKSDEERRKHIARYYASISTLDAEVGVLIEAMDRLKLWDSTIVIFTSDHGRMLGEHGGVYDKRVLFEASVRVPLIVAAPGKKANAVSPRLVELVDLYPTLCDLCGLRAAEGLEGTSFAPLLLDPEREWKKAAFTMSAPDGYRGRTIRTERYRYAEWDKGKAGVLYDYQSDPQEHKNLIDDLQHRETLTRLRTLLQEGWRKALP